MCLCGGFFDCLCDESVDRPSEGSFDFLYDESESWNRSERLTRGTSSDEVSDSSIADRSTTKVSLGVSAEWAEGFNTFGLWRRPWLNVASTKHKASCLTMVRTIFLSFTVQLQDEHRSDRLRRNDTALQRLSNTFQVVSFVKVIYTSILGDVSSPCYRCLSMFMFSSLICFVITEPKYAFVRELITSRCLLFIYQLAVLF